jgi:TolB protein
MPCISPDGKQIAFASDRAGSFDIYLMEIDGGPAVRLTEDGAQNIHPSFSPDGRRLVYCSLGSRSGVWELVVVEIDRPTHRTIIGHGLFPVWSPRGDKIAYQRARERGSRWFSLWTIDIDERGEATRPTEVAASSNAAIITPEWSADGRHLVFCTVLDPTADSPAGSRADLWICNADGTGRARLTHGRYGNLQPTWSADGSIYFVSNRGVDAVENVYALRPDQAVHLARQRERPQADTLEATAPMTPPLPE